MFIADTLTLDASTARRTTDGYMAVRARAARAGTYRYRGSEVDPEGKKFQPNDVVTVYRPAEEVFDRAAVQSFIMKPITDDHPSVAVTCDNWKQHSKGAVAGAMRDGDHLAFDLVLMDAAAITAVHSGKRELSNGYACDLSFEDGVAPDGAAYQAVQRNIRGNHVALVDSGRAGPSCRITDAAPCDTLSLLINDSGDHIVKKIMLDGLLVDLSDASAVETAIAKVQGQLTDANAAKVTAESQIATLTTDKATLEAKVATLETQLADARLTPQQLRDAAAAYGRTVEKAKALGVTVADTMDEPAIMKAAVSVKLGDAAKDWTDVQIAASFATLTKDSSVTDAGKVQNIIVPASMADAETSFADTQRKLSDQRRNAWRNPATVAA